jgi:hypothetical protein
MCCYACFTKQRFKFSVCNKNQVCSTRGQIGVVSLYFNTLMDHTDSDVSDGYNGDVGWITTVSKMKVMVIRG